MKILLLFSLLLASLSAYDIDQILNIYRKDSDLSNQTKNEALGHLVIYTRDDIERMQAYKLSDLLKSHRIVQYNENMLGMPDYLHEDPNIYRSDLIKIYINNHEITSSFTGSGLFLYGNIELGFIDHVEVYTGSSSNHISTEPSSLTIKLYTKDPEREDGGSLQGYVGSRAYNHINASYAASQKDLNYYLYASKTDGNREKYTVNNSTLTKNFDEARALMTLNYKNIKVDAEIMQHSMSPFLSYSMLAMPKESEVAYFLGRIGVTVNFLDDDSLTLSSSFIRVQETLDFDMYGTRWSSDPLDLFLTEDNLYSKSLDDIFDFKLEKRYDLDNHHLIIGSQARLKKLDTLEVTNLGVVDDTPEYVDSHIVSLYLQDDYMINDQNIFTMSGKASHYSHKSNRNNDTFVTYQARLGYILNSQSDLFKVFASYMQYPTEQYSLAISRAEGITLLDINKLTAEYKHNYGSHTFGIFGEYTNSENLPTTLIGEKIPNHYNSYGGNLEYIYNFDKFNKFESMLYTNKTSSAQTGKELKTVGGFLRVLNTLGKWDIYNELVYHELLDSPSKGTDYSAAIRYHVNEDFIVSLKGSNIFNSAAKSQYLYLDISQGVPVLETLEYSPIDQFFSIGMEYKF